MVDVYTGYIPSRRPAAKRVRSVEGCSDSNRDTDNDRALTLLHELRRHLRGRSVHTVERVKALLDDDFDDDTPVAVKLRRAEPLNTVDAVDVDIGDDGPGRSGYVDNQPNAAQLLSHVDESISKYDDQHLSKRSLFSFTTHCYFHSFYCLWPTRCNRRNKTARRSHFISGFQFGIFY